MLAREIVRTREALVGGDAFSSMTAQLHEPDARRRELLSAAVAVGRALLGSRQLLRADAVGADANSAFPGRLGTMLMEYRDA